MKLTATREDLLTPLQSVIGVVERRQTMPVLANVLLAARDNRLSVTGTDLEVELVAAIGRAGRNITAADAKSHIWGYAVGIDFTRRDRQRDARDLRLPWEAGKSFDASAPCGAIAKVTGPSHFEHCLITLSVNGVERQRGDTGQMIWSVGEVIAQLSKQVMLGAGDLIYTGTPSGVGPVVPGDLITAHIDGLPSLAITITPPEA